MPSTISAGTTAGTAIAIAGDTTGNLAFQTNGTTTAMTIDTSQRVGMGTTSPAVHFDVVSPTNGATAWAWFHGNTGGALPSSSVNSGILIGGNYSAGNSEANIMWGTGYNSATQYLAFSTYNNSTNTVTERMRIDSSGNLLFNSGYGSVATAYGCRAWVNFVGSSGAINSSGGVSSVTRNGTGDYSVNFSFTFPDANYAGTGMGRRNSSAQRAVLMVMNNTATYNQFTTYARFYTMLNDSATVEDPIFFNYTAVR